MADEYMKYDDDDAAFGGYTENTVDPGPWLLLATTVFSFTVMLVVVPLAVMYTVRRRKKLSALLPNEALKPSDRETIQATFRNIVCSQQETFKILKLAIPYTVSALTSSTFSNLCLILVSKNIGTKEVAAYALVQILVGLTDGMLLGPISACTTLCAHAVGSGNTFLAGQYIQLAISFYLLTNIPMLFTWSFFMYEIIMYLQWGDQETATASNDFVKVYIWSYILGGISNAIWQLLEVTGHAYEGTIVSIMWGATNVVVVGRLVTTHDSNLTEVGLAYIGTSMFYIGLTLIIGTAAGWFRPFWKGLLGSLALRNKHAVALMLKQSLPLSFGSLLSNAEWAVFTFFAAHLGPAEVAAWALLGSIWEIFYSVTAGIGDAAEIRVAYHLGDNHPTMARLSAYKSLMLGMTVASVVSIIYFSLQGHIPQWFTSDVTLQKMLTELVPFVGLANLTMTFGMQCWSLIGAQGKYRLATFISLISSWGVSMPLAAIFVYVYRLDLQGMTSAIVIGYLATGASLSYVLLSTDWYKVANMIQRENNIISPTDAMHDNDEDGMYSNIKPTKGASVKRGAGRQIHSNIRMLIIPAGTRPGLVLGSLYARPGTFVVNVHHWSPLYGQVKVGDSILALDCVDVSNESPDLLADRLKLPSIFDRQIVVALCPVDEEDLLGLDRTEVHPAVSIDPAADVEYGAPNISRSPPSEPFFSTFTMPSGVSGDPLGHISQPIVNRTDAGDPGASAANTWSNGGLGVASQNRHDDQNVATIPSEASGQDDQMPKKASSVGTTEAEIAVSDEKVDGRSLAIIDADKAIEDNAVGSEAPILCAVHSSSSFVLSEKVGRGETSEDRAESFTLDGTPSLITSNLYPNPAPVGSLGFYDVTTTSAVAEDYPLNVCVLDLESIAPIDSINELSTTVKTPEASVLETLKSRLMDVANSESVAAFYDSSDNVIAVDGSRKCHISDTSIPEEDQAIDTTPSEDFSADETSQQRTHNAVSPVRDTAASDEAETNASTISGSGTALLSDADPVSLSNVNAYAPDEALNQLMGVTTEPATVSGSELSGILADDDVTNILIPDEPTRETLNLDPSTVTAMVNVSTVRKDAKQRSSEVSVMDVPDDSVAPKSTKSNSAISTIVSEPAQAAKMDVGTKILEGERMSPIAGTEVSAIQSEAVEMFNTVASNQGSEADSTHVDPDVTITLLSDEAHHSGSFGETSNQDIVEGSDPIMSCDTDASGVLIALAGKTFARENDEGDKHPSGASLASDAHEDGDKQGLKDEASTLTLSGGFQSDPGAIKMEPVSFISQGTHEMTLENKLEQSRCAVAERAPVVHSTTCDDSKAVDDCGKAAPFMTQSSVASETLGTTTVPVMSIGEILDPIELEGSSTLPVLIDSLSQIEADEPATRMDERASASSQVSESIMASSTLNESVFSLVEAPKSTVMNGDSSAVSTSLENLHVDGTKQGVAEAIVNSESLVPIFASADFSDSAVNVEESEIRLNSGSLLSKDKAGGCTTPTGDCRPDETLQQNTTSLPITDVAVREETNCSGGIVEYEVVLTPCHISSNIPQDESDNQRAGVATESYILAGSDWTDTATTGTAFFPHEPNAVALIVDSTPVATGAVIIGRFILEEPPNSVILEHEHATSACEVTCRADEVHSLICNDLTAVDNCGSPVAFVTELNGISLTEGTTKVPDTTVGELLDLAGSEGSIDLAGPPTPSVEINQSIQVATEEPTNQIDEIVCVPSLGLESIVASSNGSTLSLDEGPKSRVLDGDSSAVSTSLVNERVDGSTQGDVKAHGDPDDLHLFSMKPGEN